MVSENPGFDKREGHSSVVFKDHIFVIGGKGQTKILNDVWKSKDGKEWVQITASAAFSPRFKHASFVHQGYIYVVAGEDEAGNYNNEVWKSDDGL